MKLTFTLKRTTLLIATLFVTGCGTKIERVENNAFQGQVDTALSEFDQQRQQALGRLLKAFQEGVADESDLQFQAGDILFTDGVASFYGTKKRLYRWEFKKGVTGDEFTVTLTFDGKDGGDLDESDAQIEDRTYSVTQYGGGFAIQRTK